MKQIFQHVHVWENGFFCSFVSVVSFFNCLTAFVSLLFPSVSSIHHRKRLWLTSSYLAALAVEFQLESIVLIWWQKLSSVGFFVFDHYKFWQWPPITVWKKDNPTSPLPIHMLRESNIWYSPVSYIDKAWPTQAFECCFLNCRLPPSLHHAGIRIFWLSSTGHKLKNCGHPESEFQNVLLGKCGWHDRFFVLRGFPWPEERIYFHSLLRWCFSLCKWGKRYHLVAGLFSVSCPTWLPYVQVILQSLLSMWRAQHLWVAQNANTVTGESSTLYLVLYCYKTLWCFNKNHSDSVNSFTITLPWLDEKNRCFLVFFSYWLYCPWRSVLNWQIISLELLMPCLRPYHCVGGIMPSSD